jgi:hypothetical protein
MCFYLVQPMQKQNYLNKDLHFKDIVIDVEPADKMTDNQLDAFVRNHFQKKLN